MAAAEPGNSHSGRHGAGARYGKALGIRTEVGRRRERLLRAVRAAISIPLTMAASFMEVSVSCKPLLA